MEILKIQIRVAQNVSKVWISWKKILPVPFGAIPGIFSHGPNDPAQDFAYFSLATTDMKVLRHGRLGYAVAVVVAMTAAAAAVAQWRILLTWDRARKT